MPRPLLLHRKRVEDALRQVSPQHAFLFAVACAERQWPVYERASAGQAWEMQAVLRGSLDAVWDWLLGQADRPHRAEECERAIFDEDSADEEADAAFTVSNNYYGLAAIVEDDQPEYCAQTAVSNLDLLDAFLYDLLDLPTSAASDLTVDAHELMQAEIQRQLADLEALRQPFGPDLVQALRQRARAASVLGNYWYEA